jgi:hypothetical protein
MPLQPRGITAPFQALLLMTWAGTPYCVTFPPVLMYVLAIFALVGITNCCSGQAMHRSKDIAETFQMHRTY